MNEPLLASRWQLIKRLLADALEQPADQRHAFVAAQAGDDAELLAELNTLLAASEPSRSLLESGPPAELASPASTTPTSPRCWTAASPTRACPTS